MTTIPRTRYGSILWPRDERQAWYLLCDIAEVAPDTGRGVDDLVARLRSRGEQVQRRTVERLMAAVSGGRTS